MFVCDLEGLDGMAKADAGGRGINGGAALGGFGELIANLSRCSSEMGHCLSISDAR